MYLYTNMESYPIDLIVSYQNDAEYRKCINRLFLIDENKLEYDAESSNIYMDFVFRKTKNNYSFKKLYIIAAASLMSTDQNIGLYILLSYTYLESFHKCMVYYFTNLTVYKKDIESTEHYQTLIRLFKQQ